MATEIFHVALTEQPDAELDEMGAELLGDSEIYWNDTVVDNFGNPTIIMAKGDMVSVFTGRILSESDASLSFKVLGNLKKLKPGQKESRVITDESHTSRVIHVRNLGATSILPHLN